MSAIRDFATPNPACPSYFERPAYKARFNTQDLIGGLKKLHLQKKVINSSLPSPTSGVPPSSGLPPSSEVTEVRPRSKLHNGVLASMLVEMAKHVPEEYSLRQVVETIIIPASKEHHSSFLDIPGLLHSRFTGTPNVVVATSWECNFHVLVKAINTHSSGKPQQCYWLDALSVHQHPTVRPYSALGEVLPAAAKSASMGLAILDEDLPRRGALGDCCALFLLWSVLRKHGLKAIDVVSTSGIEGDALNSIVMELAMDISIEKAKTRDDDLRLFVLHSIKDGFSDPRTVDQEIASALRILTATDRTKMHSSQDGRTPRTSSARATPSKPRFAATTVPQAAMAVMNEYPGLQTMIQQIYSGNVEEQISGTEAARKLIFDKANIQKLITAGVVPRFVQFLQDFDQPRLQFESAWVLQSITCGSTEDVQAVADAGAIPHLLVLTSNSNPEIAENVIWALGSIIGDCTRLRDDVIGHGGVEALTKILTTSTNIVVLRQASFAARNVVKVFPDSQAKMVNVKALIAPMEALLLSTADDSEESELQHDTADFFANLSHIQDARAVLKESKSLMERMVALVSSDNASVSCAGVVFLEQFAQGDQTHIQAALDAGALAALSSLLKEAKGKKACKLAASAISKILASTKSQVQAVLDAGLIPLLAQLAVSCEWSEVCKECFKCIAVLSQSSIATPDQVHSTMETAGLQVAQAIACYLQDKSELSDIALKSLMGLVKVGDLVKAEDEPNPFLVTCATLPEFLAALQSSDLVEAGLKESVMKLAPEPPSAENAAALLKAETLSCASSPEIRAALQSSDLVEAELEQSIMNLAKAPEPPSAESAAALLKAALDQLPTEKDDESKAKRKELFMGMQHSSDAQGARTLSLEEIESGILKVFDIPELYNAKAAISRAFHASKALGKSSSVIGDQYVELKEFRMLLLYLKEFFELHLMYMRIDASNDSRLNWEEFMGSLIKIESWGLSVTDPQAEFKAIDKDGSGSIHFDEFCDWALMKKLSLDDQELKAAAERALTPPGTAGTPATPPESVSGPVGTPADPPVEPPADPPADLPSEAPADLPADPPAATEGDDVPAEDADKPPSKPPSAAPSNAGSKAGSRPASRAVEARAEDKKRLPPWREFCNKLPIETDDASKEERLKLFKRFDSGNGLLSLSEVQAGILIILGSQEIYDAKPAMMRAFQAAKSISAGTAKSADDFVEWKEFRMFLVHLRSYFELHAMFDQIDSGDDDRIDFHEFESALEKIGDWGLQVSDPVAEFGKIDGNGGGKILFKEFSEWALQHRLEMFEDDE